MPHRKSKGAKAVADSKPGYSAEEPTRPASFPFARYSSVVGIHTTLQGFTALFLPRTSCWNLLKDKSASESQRNTLQVLTASPSRTVLWICAGTLLLQGWWSGWLRTWMLDMKGAAKGERNAVETTQKKLERKEWDDQRVLAFGDAALTTLVASVSFYVLIILFGAPIASHPLQTYSLACLLALLTVFTPAFILGRPSTGAKALVVRMTWIRLFAELSVRGPMDRALVYPAVGAMVGCWFGAIPIGLDWERPWQAWPLTPAYGAISGHILGSLAALAVSGTKELLTAHTLPRKSRLE